ncbi:MAG: THUMP domain-containing protein [Thaumarchaeota archaeon]|nr:THUMP domain-containing protein [Nitrososphaerota archaeon]MDE1878063.1 THUMP domain-containing protein [Nitrososphaerota archaeon]
MNLIATCSRHMEEEACNEISEIIEDLGDDSPRIGKSSFSGIIWINTCIDPFSVIDNIKKIILDEPWRMRYCHRFIPIRHTTSSNLENIVESVKNQIKIMKDIDTYRITIEKRGSDISSKELINLIADIIPNKVSLESYYWNVMIQIMGGIAGISILKEEDIVSTLRLKRDSME